MKCRHCQAKLQHLFADLAYSPVSNAMLTRDQLQEPESYFPLRVFVCTECYLVQIDEMKKADKIFDEEYTYFSSFSTSWLAHAKSYVDMMMDRFGFGPQSQVIEIASNDGYLLQFFKAYDVPVLGVDPTANTAREAEKKGIRTLVNFFGADFAREELAGKGIRADLIIGNNVLAHVPDINDFVQGMKTTLNAGGIITMEFPHLLRLVEECQFDTIYHEHFSYLSFTTVARIFETFGLEMFDVQEIPTHGGSLRIFAKHAGDENHPVTRAVEALFQKEIKHGLRKLSFYQDFQSRTDKIKYDTLEFLIGQKSAGKKIIGYGAAAKGNTLLNYCGIKGTDLIRFVIDASPHKQGKFLPGSHIPVVGKEEINTYKPDYVIILPWNLREEISQQLSFIREWGGKFVVFIPEIRIF